MQAWPHIPYVDWRETCSALHLFTQIAGKYRLAREPWVNHSWHATLYVNARGLTTGLVADGNLGVEISFDFVSHKLVVTASNGKIATFNLRPTSVGEFHRHFVDCLPQVGGSTDFSDMPNEVPNPVAFSEDRLARPYDADAVQRFHRACVNIDRVLKLFRTSFIGKVSPVHLFWGSFDLAVTRFSGRPAPRHPGGIPGLPDDVTREAYSHQVSSCGFWPGGEAFPNPAFYSYAYPAPERFSDSKVRPEGAYYHADLQEFVLPYDVVRAAADPVATLMAFLVSTYEAAASLGSWDRASLECQLGRPIIPRSL